MYAAPPRKTYSPLTNPRRRRCSWQRPLRTTAASLLGLERLLPPGQDTLGHQPGRSLRRSRRWCSWTRRLRRPRPHHFDRHRCQPQRPLWQRGPAPAAAAASPGRRLQLAAWLWTDTWWIRRLVQLRRLRRPRVDSRGAGGRGHQRYQAGDQVYEAAGC